MAQKEPRPKVFTLEEANSLLPTVQGLLQSLRSRRHEMMRIEEKRAVEELTWLQPDGTVSTRAQEEVRRLDELFSQASDAFKDALERLVATGAQLKDLEEGLVDFFAEREEELVFLCWKDGEEQIRFWHDLDSGFAGRKPLDGA
ncbi:MAG: DUF2203 domain-containing protein [Candidatus Omnitrophica bacterium]|nr:DUF2203 domain-containing protein [Candidatus Omnitrophota bacterium]